MVASLPIIPATAMWSTTPILLSKLAINSSAPNSKIPLYKLVEGLRGFIEDGAFLSCPYRLFFMNKVFALSPKLMCVFMVIGFLGVHDLPLLLMKIPVLSINAFFLLAFKNPSCLLDCTYFFYFGNIFFVKFCIYFISQNYNFYCGILL